MIIWMRSLSLLSLPVNGYAQGKSTCLQPILQHTSTCVLWKPLAIHVQEGRVDKSLHQNYRKPSHVCAIMSCTEGAFKARHQAVGIACTAIQITLLLHNLLIIMIIWYLNCVFSIFFFNSLMLLDRYKMIEIHTQRDGMTVIYAHTKNLL